jgi:hypothetical protein
MRLIFLGCALGIILGLGLSAITKPHSNEGDKEVVRLVGSSHCGIERWPVKTLSDPVASQVNLTPTRTRVIDLVKLPAPTLPSDNVTRLASELRSYKIIGTTVTAFKLENDLDIHLVLTSPKTGDTMIAEIPDPSCVQNLEAKTRIAQARAEFINMVGRPTSYYQHTKKSIAISGVLFWDFKHGQTGVAPNGVELHPVLSFRTL